MTYQDAYSALVDGVYSPIFFGKLASSYGVRPADREEAKHLLTIAGQLREAEAAQQKQASSARQGVLAGASADLGRVLKQAGVSAPAVDHDREALVKSAVDQLVADDKMRDAALVYGDFLAQVAAQG